MSRSALIVGLGLIGGSAGMALRRQGWRVSYIDPQVPEAEAMRAGAADGRAERIEGADLVVLATPVDAAVALLHKLRGNDVVVTSTSSVMRPLRAVADAAFVAGHPMAGSELRGLSAARADLFEGKRWFVDTEHALVDRLIADCGATRVLVDPDAHDRGVAMVSHLPQLLSTTLAAWLDSHPEARPYAGTGLETFLRLAESDASVWEPVFAANRDNLVPPLGEVAELAQEIAEGRAPEAFAAAQRFRRSLKGS
jgi:prephenate dehydrogenase